MRGVFGLIFRNNSTEILLVERRDMPIWVLPGGGMEKKEKEENAVRREILEETGYEVNVDRKIGKYSYEGTDKVNFTFGCSIKGGYPKLSNESKKIRFFPVDRLPEMSSPYIQSMVNDALKYKEKPISKEFKKLPNSFWLKAAKHPLALFKYLLTKVGIHWNT